MRVAIREADLHLTPLRTRLPFRYGIATMTQMPMVFLRLRVEYNGASAWGISSDILPPKWFTKQPDQSIAAEIEQMLRVIDHARSLAIGLAASSPFALWRELYEAQLHWGAVQGLAPLLANFGASLVERALLEALARRRGRSVAQLIRANGLGIELGQVHAALRGYEPRQFLPAAPLNSIWVRHTVGLGDPLTEADIPAHERLADGLPQSLEASIRRYGLRHFKVKLQNHGGQDTERLERLAALLERELGEDYLLTLDGNEQFQTLEEFRNFWERLQAGKPLAPLWRHLWFVEQPVHRQQALLDEAGQTLRHWPQHPPLIIDESDAVVESLPQALALGYAGTSHKNCKGIFKGIVNRCLLGYWQEQRPECPTIMSGEDLCNVGPVALLQDLAANAFLGIPSVERNGHHYNAGLSRFPEAVQAAVLAAHPDLYERSPAGWPTLRIHQGQVGLDSVNRAPFGVGFLLDTDQFTPLAESKGVGGITVL